MAANRPIAEAQRANDGQQKPLPKRTRAGLTVAATAVVAAFYLFCASSLFLIAVLLTIDLLVCVGAARFLLSRYMVPPIKALAELVSLLLKSMAIQTGPQTYLSLWREDVPRLYDIVRETAGRVGVDPPNEIVLEMINNAGVRLLGYRVGRGRCKLMLGYDMLTILTEGELTSVLAHEMAHVKLVNRGYSNWLWNSILRVNQLGAALHGLVSRMKAQRKQFYAASILLKMTSVFARAGSKLVALYERQDEFAADRIAAELCGTEIVSRGLIKMHIADSRSANLSWRDRIVQTQRGGSFSEWLRSELTPTTEEERSRLEGKAMLPQSNTRYDCHPVLPDRLAALPSVVGPAYSDRPAIELLDDPDAVAERLIANEEKVIKEHEGKDQSKIRKSARASGGAQKLTGRQFLAAIIGVFVGIGLAVLIIIALAERNPGLVLPSVGLACVVALCMLLYRRSKFVERMPLPFPTLSAWEQALEARSSAAEDPDWRKNETERLKSQTPWNLNGRKAKARYWADVCYESLGRCDYKQAWASSEMCLKLNKRSYEGLMGRCVASAYFGWSDECKKAINKACETYNIEGSFAWAMGWLTSLFENWEPAEKYLLQTTFDTPGHPTPWALLGNCQWQLGKPRQGLDSLRRANSLDPNEPRQCAMLVKMLLASGQVNEALEHFETLDRLAGDQLDVRLCGVRVNALLGRHEEAERRANALLHDRPGEETLLSLAQVYNDARLPEKAKGCYEAVCKSGFNPDAYIGLARLDYEADEYEKARSYLMSALDLTRERSAAARHPLTLLEVICRGLNSMGDSGEGCSAWRCRVDVPDAIEGVESISLIIFAKTQQDARELALQVCRAMYPGEHDPALTWEPADKDDKPSDSMVPGVYGYRFNAASMPDAGKREKRGRAA